MKLLLAALLFWSACLASGFAQEDADNRYLVIYGQIQQANSLLNSGQLSEALAAYQTAQSQLLDFQKIYPAWDADIVDYRLSDVADKIASLKAQLPASAATPAAPTPAATPSPPQNQAAAEQVWQQQLQSLKDDNARLKAKLQEALSLQPPAADADALAKANSQIRELMKENALLEIGHAAQEPTASEKELADLKARLEESEKKQAGQQALIAKLTAQNHALQARLDQTSRTNQVLLARVREEDRQLQSRWEATQTAAAQVNALKSAVLVAGLERKALEDRLKQLTTELVRTDERYETSLYDLTAQRDALAQRLKDSVPAEPAGPVIEINTAPGADQIRHPDQPSTGVRQAETDGAANQTNASPDELPPLAAALAKLAQQHFADHQFSLAESDYRKILQLAPQNALALGNLAAIELEENKLDEAQTNITTALALKPEDAYNLAQRGKIEFERGDATAALADLRQAAQLAPNNPEIQNYLGLTLNRLGQRDAAEKALMKAIQINPNYPHAHNNLAVLYLSDDPPLPQLARWHYEMALRGGEPRNPQLEKWLAQKGAPVNSGN